MLEQALRETIRVQDGRAPLLDRHLDRLRAGGCDQHTLVRAQDAALEAVRTWGQPYGRMTLLVSTDGAVAADIDERPSTIRIDGGPVIIPVRSEVPPLPPGAAKPADRSFWDESLGKAKAQGGTSLSLVDDEGRIMDGSQATVWFVIDGLLVTPPSPPAMAGVSRTLVLGMASDWGYEVEVRDVYERDIESADEIILTTAVGGAVAVRDHSGPTALALASHLGEIFAGQSGDDS